MSSQKKKQGSVIKSVTIAIFFVAIVLFYFQSLNNRATEDKTEKKKTEIEYLTDYDMIGDYPKTPRDVVKLYCRYYKLFYSQKLDDDELRQLNSKLINIYSDELMKYNTETSMLAGLKKNIKKMRDEGYSYKAYLLPEASQIKTYTQDGKEMATMEVEITMDMKDSKGYIYEQFVLVKEADRWKILAWGDSELRNSDK